MAHTKILESDYVVLQILCSVQLDVRYEGHRATWR